MVRARFMAWVVGVAGCVPITATEPPAPPMLPDTWVKYERMALFADGFGEARFRGFDDAAPQFTQFELRDQNTGELLATVEADVNGRFDTLLRAEAGTKVTVQPRLSGEDAEPLVFTVRDRSTALTDMVRERIAGTGSTPNRVLFAQDAPAQGASTAFVVLSGDGALDSVDADTGRRVMPLCAFPEVQGPHGPLPATPWSADARGSVALVTRYDQGGITAVDTGTGAILAEAAPNVPVPLGTVMHLDPALDVNGDTVAESEITELVPRTPTGVALVGNRAFVAFGNVLDGAQPGRAQFANAFLVVFDLDGRGVPTSGYQAVPLRYHNPQHVVPTPDGLLVLVSGTGDLQRGSEWETQTDGGVEAFSTSTLQRRFDFNLGRFAPSRPVILPNGLEAYVPSILRARLARLSLTDGRISRGPATSNGPIELDNSDDLRTTFECGLHPTGLVFCGLFDTDALVVVDSRDDAVRPWPFNDVIALGEGSGAMKQGLQSLAMRPGRNGVDRNGNDILVLLSLSSRVAALDTRFVLGP